MSITNYNPFSPVINGTKSAYKAAGHAADNITCALFNPTSVALYASDSAAHIIQHDFYGGTPPSALSYTKTTVGTTWKYLTSLAPLVAISSMLVNGYNRLMSPYLLPSQYPLAYSYAPIINAISPIATPAGPTPSITILSLWRPVKNFKLLTNYLSANPLLSIATFILFQSKLVPPSARNTINITVMFASMFLAAETAAMVMPILIGLAAAYGIFAKSPYVTKKLLGGAQTVVPAIAARFNPQYGMMATMMLKQMEGSLLGLNSTTTKAAEQLARPFITKDDTQYRTTITANQRRLLGKEGAANPQAIDISRLRGYSFADGASLFSIEDGFSAAVVGNTPSNRLFSSQTGGTIDLGDKIATVNSEQGYTARAALITAQTQLEAIVHFLNMKSTDRHAESGKQLSRLERIKEITRQQQANPQDDAQQIPATKLTFTASAADCALAKTFIERHYGADDLQYFEFNDSKTNKPVNETTMQMEANKVSDIHNKALDYMFSVNPADNMNTVQRLEAEYGNFNPEVGTPISTIWRVLNRMAGSFFKHHKFTDEMAEGKGSEVVVSAVRPTTSP
ncbi:MAG: hypothetical protein P1U34_06620 [Coxiellaceae bacterium]|nr:hypothetical protein [Coxiellaceae bacterium]